MRRTKTILAAMSLLIASLILPSSALAAFGDGFGFAEINTDAPAAQETLAFSGIDPETGELVPLTRAIWAGTCDLASASTAGAFGPHNGGEEPPAVRPHCLDLGASSIADGGVSNLLGELWPTGGEPAWRLTPVTQAGAHPDATAAFYFSRVASEVDGAVKNIIVKLPPGVVGNPEALGTQCPAFAVQAVPPECPAQFQVGIVTAAWGVGAVGQGLGPSDFETYPVYVTEARDTVTAEFAVAQVAGMFNVPVTARGRTNSDYGVDTLALLIPDFVALFGQTATFWGVPWAEEHDKFRFDGICMKEQSCGAQYHAGSIHVAGVDPALRRPYDPSWGPIRPFFTNPTECSGERLPVTVEMDSWQNQVARGGEFVTGTVQADVLEGCEKLSFDPQIELRPTVRVSDSPSGLDVKLSIQQNNNPPQEALGNPSLAHDPDDDTGAPAYWRTDAGLATAHLKDTVVRLPAGTSFNPAAANGLRGCTQAEVGVTALEPKVTFNNDPHHCPDNSKIGTLEIVSPLLPDPLFGSVYAAPQHDNPFPGSLTAIYMVAQDEERGLSIKLSGKVDLDPATGQIATTFIDNPQLPFDTFELHFKTGPRAPLNTPPVCGQFKNSSNFVPWSFPHSGPTALIEDPFDITQMPNGFSCVTEPEDRSFSPGFEAGTTSTQAGADTDFVLNVTRRDGEQEVSGLSLDMPQGLVAKLADTPYCSDQALSEIEGARAGLQESNGSLCPAASELGVVHTLAGAGELPLPTSGKLYLAGPYDGAPVSVAAIVPAIAGGAPGAPSFDLGNVVVRSAAHVDPRTAQVKVRSAPLPYIVGGVPLRVRRVSVDITKPGFMRNPTSCAPMSIRAQISGAGDPLAQGDGAQANPSAPFQVGGCENLGFKPKLDLRVFGKTKRGAYQRLRATLTARPGDANIGRASVTMPRSAFLAQEHIRTICTRVQFAANSCPPGSIYGKASATSPLLDYPLSGPVYLRSSDNPLPDLVVDLRGPDHQPVRIELVGRTDSVKGALRNTFDVTPDAPVSKFNLEIFGGKRALIRLSQNICTGARKASVRLGAHNGRTHNFRPVVKNPKCKRQKRKAKSRKRGAHQRGGKAKGRSQ